MNFLQKTEFALYRMSVKFYRLPSDSVSQCDVIVPHCYGLLENGDLPDATKKTMGKAVSLGRTIPKAVILIPTVNYFGEEAQRMEKVLKRGIIEASGIKNRVVFIDDPCNNSALEVRYALEEIRKQEIPCRSVAVICDAPHMRSIRRIWDHYSKKNGVQVALKSVEANWFQAHHIFWQRSPLRWLAANFARHLFMIIFGVDRAAAVQFKK